MVSGDLKQHIQPLATFFAWDFSVLTDQLRILMRIKRNIIDSHPELALADDKCAATLLELIVSSIHRDHGGVVEGELPWASHVVMFFQVYMVNSTYCERIFALADRLHGKLCGGGGMPNFGFWWWWWRYGADGWRWRMRLR